MRQFQLSQAAERITKRLFAKFKLGEIEAITPDAIHAALASDIWVVGAEITRSEAVEIEERVKERLEAESVRS